MLYITFVVTQANHCQYLIEPSIWLFPEIHSGLPECSWSDRANFAQIQDAEPSEGPPVDILRSDLVNSYIFPFLPVIRYSWSKASHMETTVTSLDRDSEHSLSEWGWKDHLEPVGNYQS